MTRKASGDPHLNKGASYLETYCYKELRRLFCKSHAMILSRVTYIVSGIGLIVSFILWYYAILGWSAASLSAKMSTANSLSGGALALAGIILVFLGFTFSIRDQTSSTPGYSSYTRMIFILFLPIPLSLISSFTATIYALSGSEPFLLVSLSALFLTGVLLILGSMLLVAKVVKR